MSFYFFWRDTYKNEVDIVLNKERITPIEVKYGEIKDIDGLLKFMDLFNVKEGFVISRDNQKEKKVGNKKILIIPAWKWFLNTLSN